MRLNIIAPNQTEVHLNEKLKIVKIQKYVSVFHLAIDGIGTFNNYVNGILTTFDHLPTPSKQMY